MVSDSSVKGSTTATWTANRFGNPLLINLAASTNNRVETVSVKPNSVRFLILVPIVTYFWAISASIPVSLIKISVSTFGLG